MTDSMYQCEKYVRSWHQKVRRKAHVRFLTVFIGVPTGIRTPVTTVKGLGHAYRGTPLKPSDNRPATKCSVNPVAYSITPFHNRSHQITPFHIRSRHFTPCQCENNVRPAALCGGQEIGRIPADLRHAPIDAALWQEAIGVYLDTRVSPSTSAPEVLEDLERKGLPSREIDHVLEDSRTEFVQVPAAAVRWSEHMDRRARPK